MKNVMKAVIAVSFGLMVAFGASASDVYTLKFSTTLMGIDVNHKGDAKLYFLRNNYQIQNGSTSPWCLDNNPVRYGYGLLSNANLLQKAFNAQYDGEGRPDYNPTYFTATVDCGGDKTIRIQEIEISPVQANSLLNQFANSPINY